MSTKWYAIEIWESKHSSTAFFQEFKAKNYLDALSQAKFDYPESTMFNVYINVDDVSISEGGNKWHTNS